MWITVIASLRYENMYPLTKSTILTNGILLYKDIYKENEGFIWKQKKKCEQKATS